MHNSLLSENNCSLTFDCDAFIVQDLSTGRILYKGTQSNGIYPIHFNTISSSPSSWQPLAFLSATEVWHRRLGHPSFHSLQRINKSFALTDFLNKPLFCNECQQGCSHKQPFQLYNFISLEPLVLLHTDIWGPCNVISSDGSICYASFIDDYSKNCWLFPLSLKSDFKHVFISFVNKIELLLQFRMGLPNLNINTF